MTARQDLGYDYISKKILHLISSETFLAHQHVIKDYVLGFYYHFLIIIFWICNLHSQSLFHFIFFGGLIFSLLFGRAFILYQILSYLFILVSTRLYLINFRTFFIISSLPFSLVFDWGALILSLLVSGILKFLFSHTYFGFTLSFSTNNFFIGIPLIFTIINLLTIGLHLFIGSLIFIFFPSHLVSILLSYERIIFWKSIHLEVASESFCLLINSSWLLIFTLIIILFIFTGFNIYCWTGIQFSSSNFIIFIHLFFGFIFSFHFWCRDLLREFQKKYEILLIIFFLLFSGFLISEALLFVSFFWTSFHSLSSPTLGLWPGETFYIPDPCELTFANTLLLSNAAISLGNTFINLEISSQFYIFFTLFSFYLSSLFISLQIKEFRIMALSINDSLYSCLFFFLTGLHFFHLTIGLLLLSLLFWSCSFSYSLLAVNSKSENLKVKKK